MRVLSARLLAASLAILVTTSIVSQISAPAHAEQALASPVHPAPASKLWSLSTEAFTPPGACPELARRQTLYRVCDDQRVIFREALERARRDGNLLLVTFGSTWCPGCRAFSTQLEQSANGGNVAAGRFTRVEIAISTLKDGRRIAVTTGEDVLKRVLASTPGATMRGVPFIAVIDPNDATRSFARNLDDTEMAGGGSFDLQRIDAILAQADAHVRKGAAAPSEPGWLARKMRRWFAL